MVDPTVDLPADGPGAPPRANGEVVFEEPWQRRAFGLAVSLSEEGAYEWSVFQQALIARIGVADVSDAPFDYWRCWLGALEDVVDETGLAGRAAVDERSAALAARPPGHDHGDHDHHHDHA